MKDSRFDTPKPLPKDVLDAIERTLPDPVKGQDLCLGTFRRLKASEKTRAEYVNSWRLGIVFPSFRRIH